MFFIVQCLKQVLRIIKRHIGITVFFRFLHKMEEVVFHKADMVIQNTLGHIKKNIQRVNARIVMYSFGVVVHALETC